MKIASLAKVKAKLSAYIEAARSGPVGGAKNGSVAAVLIAGRKPRSDEVICYR